MLRTHGNEHEETIPPSSTDEVALNVQAIPEDKPLLAQDEEDKDKASKPVAAKKKEAAAAPPTKVLFLDGIRGLAAIMVVTQHSHEYMQDLNLGAVAVDAFFVLSSFLLTWLFMKKNEDKKRYFLVKQVGSYDLFKVLTFDFDHRYFVFWTLPLEISYYFFIPVIVLGVLLLRRFWWVPFIPAYYWIVNEGWNEYRTSHSVLRPHIPTFLAGSMAAVIFVKLDAWIKASGFQFLTVHKLLLRAIEFSALAVFLSIAFRGLWFNWVHGNTAPKTPGFPFISVVVTTVFVCEMILPSPLSTAFESSVLRYWGKISFSVYLLHSFVLYNPTVSMQKTYYDRMFARFGLLLILATASYHLVEYPSQLLAQRITKALAEQEAKGSGGLTVFWGEWINPTRVLAERLAWMQMLGVKSAYAPKQQAHESAV
ncbi:hypothetical protein BBJ29_005839 [Phytophthora kernoviae]|uniref:Acyltransferase 3 domain-containing protein n=1 Tax=Phytophthora kernoviae TaxID=325452 RepID=A0A3F2RHA9_9STRA|nr:hypothetical protein BBJ29_005839 [Phytophthora kernoviae]RLN56865.1 hypothetical protein BBP00_00007789 [Phytophthora kernoviae]